MKIWVIGKAIPNAKNNFLGNFELEQARMLQKHGEDVVYIANDFRPINCLRRFGMHKVISDSVTAYEVSLPLRGFGIPNCMSSLEPKICKKLYKTVEKEEGGFPDIIHVHFPSLINSGVHEYYQKLGVKIIVTEHYSQVLLKRLSEPYLTNLQWYTRNADAVISVSDILMNSIIEIAGEPKKTFIVPNIISTKFCYKASNHNNFEFTFIAINRLIKEKRVDYIIKAFAKLRNELKANLKLKIVGGGELLSQLQDIVNQLQLKNSVELLGPLEPDKVADEIRLSDAYVSASKIETFCVPAAEAMACGKPVIVDASIGIASFVNESNGFKTELDTVDDIVLAMKKIFENRDFYNAINISDYALKNFSMNSVYKQIRKIYDIVT